MPLLALLFVLLSLFAPSPATPKAGPRLYLKSKAYAFDAPPAELSDAAKALVLRWKDFCTANGYSLHADATGRVFLALEAKSTRASGRLARVEKTSAWFDARLPSVHIKDSSVTEPPADRDAPLAPGTSRTWSWSSEDLVPDQDSALLFVLPDEAQYKLLLEELARQEPSLSAWSASARQETGFVVPRPLSAAYIENAAGMEEWDPEHELVNRCAQLLLVQRFGLQPFWLQQGIGWSAEWGFDASLYCFPFRKEFIYATEHSAWPNELKKRFEKSSEARFDFSSFDGYRRGRWDGERARLAFGATMALLRHPPPKLALALEELRRWRDSDNRKSTGPNTWERDPNYEISADKMKSVFATHLGADFDARVLSFLRAGSAGYKAP